MWKKINTKINVEINKLLKIQGGSFSHYYKKKKSKVLFLYKIPYTYFGRLCHHQELDETDSNLNYFNE
jgi:hypothetical protein